MKIPKIKFNVMSIEENIETIKWFYFDNNGVLSVHDLTIEYFPELSYLDESLSMEEKCSIIEEIVSKHYKENELKIKEEVKRYNNIWEKYNDIYLETLSKYLDTAWPTDLDIIEGKIGLLPVFPRFLDSYSFSISADLKEWKVLETCAHETLHFLWFKKWKEMYPETPRNEYDSPHLVWQYSEMVTDPILNNKPFTDIFEFLERGYNSFYEIYDGENLVMDKLRKIYYKDMLTSEKIEEGYEYIKKVLDNQRKR